MENGGGWGGDVEGDYFILMIILVKELKRVEGKKLFWWVFFG